MHGNLRIGPLGTQKHMVIILMVILYCEPVPSGHCCVVVQYSLCDTYWKVKNLFVMQVYTRCTGNIGHSAFISGYFCVWLIKYRGACVRCRDTNLLFLNPGWQCYENAEDPRAHNTPMSTATLTGEEITRKLAPNTKCFLSNIWHLNLGYLKDEFVHSLCPWFMSIYLRSGSVGSSWSPSLGAHP